MAAALKALFPVPPPETLPTEPPPLLLLTRPRPQSADFAVAARAALPPHDLLIAPLTEIAPLAFDPSALAGARGLVLTSANAVAAIAGLPGLAGLPAWCVGEGTASAARAAGLATRVSGGDAAHLLADLRAARPPGPLVHVHGRHLACDLVATLRPEGFEIRGVMVYEARAVDWPPDVREALAGRRVVVPLFSPRAATEFAARFGDAVPGGLTIVAISVRCAARLTPALRGRARVAREPSAEAMLRAIADAMSHETPEP